MAIDELPGVYRQYKDDTNYVASWLVCDRRFCPLWNTHINMDRPLQQKHTDTS